MASLYLHPKMSCFCHLERGKLYHTSVIIVNVQKCIVFRKTVYGGVQDMTGYFGKYRLMPQSVFSLHQLGQIGIHNIIRTCWFVN